MKKLMIAATSSGAGKTTVTLGILQALKNKGLNVQPFKVGPDYVDTEYHTRITKNPSRNLDMFLVREGATLHYLFNKAASTCDVAIIEGVMGLFDGLGTDKDCCSSASVAKQLDCPVLLVIDGKSTSTSAAAIVKGFVEFDPDVKIAGVIINNVASENHFELIKQSILRYTNTPVWGCLYKNKEFSLPSRQLGLVPDREIDTIVEKIQLVAHSLEKSLDIDGLLATLPEVELATTVPKKRKQYPNLKVAYALDEAFHFYYPDNLELLKECGVTLVSFSPMSDEKLPEADLYYLGGGYPEEFADELAKNVSMRQQILKKHQEGAFILAECGGLMYLGEQLAIEENNYPMVGVFHGTSKMTNRLKRFGYCYGVMGKDSLIGEQSSKVYGHEFHHSIFETAEPTVMTMVKERDGKPISTWQGGYQKHNTFASYIHLHFYQSPDFIENLLNKISQV